jgi:hypothetical protein
MPRRSNTNALGFSCSQTTAMALFYSSVLRKPEQNLNGPLPNSIRLLGAGQYRKADRNRSVVQTAAMSAMERVADLSRTSLEVRFVPILLQKSVETDREA